MIRKIFFCLFAACAITAQAQNDSTKIAIEQINRIKLDAEHYLYSEVTMPDWLEAYNAAKSLLKEQLSAWLVNNHKDADVTSYVARSDEHIFEIKAQRGNRYRAFVYIKKSDILAFKEERQLVTVTSDDMKDKAAEESLFRIPESPAAASTPAPSPAPAPTPLPAASAASAPAPPAASAPSLAGIEKDMLSVSTFADIEAFIASHQEDGSVTGFGKYASRPSSGTYYMFVYNRNAEIPAYLKVDDGKIINLKTAKEDSMDAYKNCGAIWFR